MPDSFTTTVAFLFVTALVGAFARRRARDRCLMSFCDDAVVLETADDIIRGTLSVENTGLELVYPRARTNRDGHQEWSYLLYKFEYSSIHALARYHADLTPAGKTARERELRQTYHPTIFRRLRRQTWNTLKTVRDSVMELVDGVLSATKRAIPAGAVLTAQDKYVSQMKQDLAGSIGTSFEPLMEKYIGHRVVVDVIKDEGLRSLSGVLKDYTADFVEILDVDYGTTDGAGGRSADIVMPRRHAVVRHVGESRLDGLGQVTAIGAQGGPGRVEDVPMVLLSPVTHA